MTGRLLKEKMKKKALVVPGAFDALSALLVQKLEFPAVYLSGAGFSVSHLGQPDIGLLTLDEVVSEARRWCQVVSIPVLVDVDTGYGGAVNLARTVSEMERAGVAGIQIEDQTFPKRCGHLKGKSVIPASDMVKKIKIAVKTRKNRDFLIIARSDARSVTGFSDLLRRCQAYKRAGADIIFPEALPTKAEFKTMGSKKSLGPLMANMTEFGVSPSLTATEVASFGYRLILYPMTAFRIAAHSMQEALLDLKKTGNTKFLEPKMQTRQELYELIHYDAYESKEKEWMSPIKKRKGDR